MQHPVSGLRADPDWQRANSRWRYWTWTLGIFTWVGFAWAAVRARRPWWGVVAAVYAAPFALGPLLGPALGPALLLVFVAGLLHAQRLLPEYLDVRAEQDRRAARAARPPAPAPQPGIPVEAPPATTATGGDGVPAAPDPFPIGAYVCDGAYLVIEHLHGEPTHGILRAIDAAGHPALVTIGPPQRGSVEALTERLSYRGIVHVTPLLGFGTVDGRRDLHVMVEAEPDGYPLSECVDEPLAVPQVVAIAETLADVLKDARAHGLPAIGLRPQQIYARETGGHPSVTAIVPRAIPFLRTATTPSFGVAPLFDQLFTTPEEIRDQPSTAASDVFALCLVLAWLTTLRHPFAGSTMLETMMAIVSDERAPWSGPARLGKILYAGLAGDPARRPPLNLLMAQLRTLDGD